MADGSASLDRKIERADQHVKDLNDALAAFHEAKTKAVVPQDDPNSPDRREWVISDASISDQIPLILGDAAHNLRSALDHLIGDLIRANRGAPNTKAEFPIWRYGNFVRDKYESSVDGKVRGASKSVIGELKSLQPYEGGDHQLLWALDQLDIIDKHRLLIVVAIRSRYVAINVTEGFMQEATKDWETPTPDLWVGLHPAEREPLKDGDVLWSVNKSEKTQPGDHPQFAFDITLGEPKILEGDAILPAIAQLRTVTLETIEHFRKLI